MQSYSGRAKRRWAFGLGSLGVLWTAAMIPGAFYLPVYGRSSSEHTLVGVNGTWVGVALLLLLTLSVVAWLGLRASKTSGSSRGGKVGTVAAWLLGVTAFLGFALGAIVLSAALAWLLVAAAILLLTLGALVLPTALAWLLLATAIVGFSVGALALPAALAVVFATSLTPRAV